MELVVIFLLLESLKRLTAGGTIQLQERRLLQVRVNGVGDLLLLLLLRGWLGSNPVGLELVELQ